MKRSWSPWRRRRSEGAEMASASVEVSTNQELAEECSGKKKSKFQTFKKFFKRKKRKEENLQNSASNDDLNQGSEAGLGSRAQSHDSVFACDWSEAPEALGASQDSLSGKVKSLQMQLKQSLLCVKRSDPRAGDDSLPHSPPEYTEMKPQRDSSISLDSGELSCPGSSRAVSPLVAAPGDFSSPASASVCLNNSAAKHRVQLRPRGKKRRSRPQQRPELGPDSDSLLEDSVNISMTEETEDKAEDDELRPEEVQELTEDKVLQVNGTREEEEEEEEEEREEEEEEREEEESRDTSTEPSVQSPDQNLDLDLDQDQEKDQEEPEEQDSPSSSPAPSAGPARHLSDSSLEEKLRVGLSDGEEEEERGEEEEERPEEERQEEERGEDEERHEEERGEEGERAINLTDEKEIEEEVEEEERKKEEKEEEEEEEEEKEEREESSLLQEVLSSLKTPLSSFDVLHTIHQQQAAQRETTQRDTEMETEEEEVRIRSQSSEDVQEEERKQEVETEEPEVGMSLYKDAEGQEEEEEESAEEEEEEEEEVEHFRPRDLLPETEAQQIQDGVTLTSPQSDTEEEEEEEEKKDKTEEEEEDSLSLKRQESEGNQEDVNAILDQIEQEVVESGEEVIETDTVAILDPEELVYDQISDNLMENTDAEMNENTAIKLQIETPNPAEMVEIEMESLETTDDQNKVEIFENIEQYDQRDEEMNEKSETEEGEDTETMRIKSTSLEIHLESPNSKREFTFTNSEEMCDKTDKTAQEMINISTSESEIDETPNMELSEKNCNEICVKNKDLIKVSFGENDQIEKQDISGINRETCEELDQMQEESPNISTGDENKTENTIEISQITEKKVEVLDEICPTPKEKRVTFSLKEMEKSEQKLEQKLEQKSPNEAFKPELIRPRFPVAAAWKRSPQAPGPEEEPDQTQSRPSPGSEPGPEFRSDPELVQESRSEAKTQQNVKSRLSPGIRVQDSTPRPWSKKVQESRREPESQPVLESKSEPKTQEEPESRLSPGTEPGPEKEEDSGDSGKHTDTPTEDISQNPFGVRLRRTQALHKFIAEDQHQQSDHELQSNTSPPLTKKTISTKPTAISQPVTTKPAALSQPITAKSPPPNPPIAAKPVLPWKPETETGIKTKRVSDAGGGSEAPSWISVAKQKHKIYKENTKDELEKDSIKDQKPVSPTPVPPIPQKPCHLPCPAVATLAPVPPVSASKPKPQKPCHLSCPAPAPAKLMSSPPPSALTARPITQKTSHTCPAPTTPALPASKPKPSHVSYPAPAPAVPLSPSSPPICVSPSPSSPPPPSVPSSSSPPPLLSSPQDEPPWMALAKKKAKAWSEMPQIVQ